MEQCDFSISCGNSDSQMWWAAQSSDLSEGLLSSSEGESGSRPVGHLNLGDPVEGGAIGWRLRPCS